MRFPRVYVSATVLTILFTATSMGQGNSSQETVGDYGDPDRLTVLVSCPANQAPFTADDVKKGLQSSVELIVASHPMAPLEPYVSLLQERILWGFLRAGFPDAEVELDINRYVRRITAKVETGPRILSGNVRVEGAETVNSEALAEWLTTPRPPRDARRRLSASDGPQAFKSPRGGETQLMELPAWQPGKPAQFDPPAQRQLSRLTGEALADLGCFFPEVNVTVERLSKSEQAELVVTIKGEGPRAVLGKIEIDGNKRNSRESIIEYLGLEEGIRFNQVLVDEYTRRLHQSARFIDASINTVRPSSRDDAVNLKISLIEYAKAPLLDEELSPEMATMVRLCDWVSNPENWDGDLLLDYQSEELHIRAAVSPELGITIVGERSHKEEHPNVALTLRAAADGFVVHSSSLERALTSSAGWAKIMGSLAMKLNESPNDPKQPRWMSLGVGVERASDQGDCPSPPFALKLDLQPSAFLSWVCADGVRVSDEGDVCTIEVGDAESFQIETATGRLIKYSGVRAGDDGSDLRVSFSFRRGAFETLSNQLQKRLDSEKTSSAPLRPSTAISMALQDEFLGSLLRKQVSDSQQEPFGLLGRALVQGAMAPVDAVAGMALGGNASRFTVPTHDKRMIELGQSPQGILVLIFGLPTYGKLFPRDSWPWLVGREAMLLVAGQSQYTSATLKSLVESDENGPICFLVTASLLQRVSPQMAGFFANEGLKRLAIDDFRKDYRILTEQESPVSESFLRAAAILRDLEDEQLTKQSDNASSGDGGIEQLLAASVEVLRGEPNRPLGEALPEALDHAWETGLKDYVEAALRKIRDDAIKSIQGLTMLSERRFSTIERSEP